MSGMFNKLKEMEAEMDRFEAEIAVSASRPVIGSSTFTNVQRQLQRQQQPGFGSCPPPPPPPFIPPQLQRDPALRPPPPSVMPQSSSGSSGFSGSGGNIISAAPKVYSSKPVLKKSPTPTPAYTITPSKPETYHEPPPKKLKSEKSKSESKSSKSNVSAYGFIVEDLNKKKEKKPKKMIRTAGGQVWEDTSLQDWDSDDFRIFCGDLGNDVTDEVLSRAFNKYPSFIKAKVVRDKRNNKTKGFGFVSFKDPQDFIRAMKEMDGRYVGSRPIKLRKSMWKNRNIDIVKKKEREKAALINLVTGK